MIFLCLQEIKIIEEIFDLKKIIALLNLATFSKYGYSTVKLKFHGVFWSTKQKQRIPLNKVQNQRVFE
jgi:exonuclease III